MDDWKNVDVQPIECNHFVFRCHKYTNRLALAGRLFRNSDVNYSLFSQLYAQSNNPENRWLNH